ESVNLALKVLLECASGCPVSERLLGRHPTAFKKCQHSRRRGSSRWLVATFGTLLPANRLQPLRSFSLFPVLLTTPKIQGNRRRAVSILGNCPAALPHNRLSVCPREDIC